MDAVFHRIEALPGDGRYAVTFRRADGSEQTAVVQLSATEVDVAEASLPAGWSRTSEVFVAVADALRAIDAARRHASPAASLRDVDGGWDVSLGNVVLDATGVPRCTAHGQMTDAGDESFVCAECGARAALA